MKRRYRGKVTYSKTIYFAIILLILGIIFIKLGTDFEENILPIYECIAEKKDGYIVTLKPNDFYQSETLSSGGYYASKSIKEYILNFRYDFTGNNSAYVEYNYNIIADLVGTVQTGSGEDKEVWNRRFVLNEGKAEKSENAFSINEQTNIDYEYYNNLARSYEEKYNIVINCVLKIRLNVFGNINLLWTDENKRFEDYIELNIPITNTVTNVTENYEKKTNFNIYSDKNKISYEAIFYIFGIAIIIISIALFAIEGIRKYKKTPEEKHSSEIKGILKYYNNLIVVAKEKPDISSLKVIYVTSINDLVNVAQQCKTNIIYYDKFYAITNGYAYVYDVCCKLC